MFNFSVRRLWFLKNVPLLPILFECWLQLITRITNPAISPLIEEIEAEVSSWDGIRVTLHKYGGLQFNYLNKEIGHIHGIGLLDILFTRKMRNQLVSEGKVLEHHVYPNSGWISFYIKTKSDLNTAIELLKMSKELKAKQHVSY
jgi:hypothetical protein